MAKLSIPSEIRMNRNVGVRKALVCQEALYQGTASAVPTDEAVP